MASWLPGTGGGQVGNPGSTEAQESTATRALLAGAGALLIVTAVTGALDGLDLLRTIALHGPVGTLGWLTLGVFAAATALFPPGGAPSRIALLAWLPIGAMTAHTLGTWVGHDGVETASTLLALAAAVGFGVALSPAVRRAAPLTVPHLGILAALAILTAGIAFDLGADVSEIGEADWVPFRVAGARSPSIAAVSVLAGMALVEWRLAAPLRAATADTWGIAQVMLFVAGWLTLVAGVAAGSLNLLVSNVMFQALAVMVFIVRIANRLSLVRWRTPEGNRWYGLVVLYVAAHLGLLAHLAVGVMGRHYVELASVPEWLTFAVDHVVFVGVVANALFGLTGAGRLDSAAFWATNGGMIGLVMGLAGDLAVVTGAAAAVMAGGMIVGAFGVLSRLRTPLAGAAK